MGVLTGLTVAMVGHAFVDDTDLVYNARDNKASASSLLPSFQGAVNHWEGLLRATGGALEPAKTFFFGT